MPAPVIGADTAVAENGRLIWMSEVRIIADTRNAKQHWERRGNPIPYLMVPMSDGTTVRYIPDIPQPAFQKAMNNIKNMKTGYERKEDK